MDYISILSAFLTPVVAVATVIIGYFQWKTNDSKRNNDLFDMRYKFYRKICDWWCSTSDYYDDSSWELGIEDAIPWAEEGGLLFGEDIENHIISLVGKRHIGVPYFPDESFTSPFKEYLKIK